MEKDINDANQLFTDRANANNNYGFGKGESKNKIQSVLISTGNATKNFMSKKKNCTVLMNSTFFNDKIHS